MRKNSAVVLAALVSYSAAYAADGERVIVQKPKSSQDHVVVQPIQLGDFAPQYPSQLLSGGVSGSVVVKFVITWDGRTRDAAVMDATPAKIFDEAALAAVRESKWTPGTVDGGPSDFQRATIIQFDADRARGAKVQLASLSPDCKAALACNHSSNGCMTIGISNNSQCGIECAMDLRRELMNGGVTARVPHLTGGPGRKDGRGCIGYRADLGGSAIGAACIARILGNRFEVGSCGKDQWPYSVRTY